METRNGSGGGEPKAGKEAAKKAAKLAAEALEATVPEERVALAHDALSLDKGCADAWTVLAREAARERDEERAFVCAKAAVKAADEALDEGARRLLYGSSRKLWRRKVLRPYLRALGEYARSLREVGDLEGAIRTAKEQVLGRAGFDAGEGPPDIRALEDDVALWLVEAGKAEEAFGILDNIPEEEKSAPMLYTQVLAYLDVHGWRRQSVVDLAYELVSEAVWRCGGIAMGLVGPEPHKELWDPIGNGLCEECDRYLRNAWPVWRERRVAMGILSEALGSLGQSGDAAGNAGDAGERVRLLMVRDPVGEEPDVATFKAALEGLIRARAQQLGLDTEFLRADLPPGGADGWVGAPQMLVVKGDGDGLYALCEELSGAEATSGYVVIADREEDAVDLAQLGINVHAPEVLEGPWAQILAQIDGNDR